MAETRKRERVFAIVVAILFVITSLGLSLIVIWQNLTLEHDNMIQLPTPALKQESATAAIAQCDDRRCR